MAGVSINDPNAPSVPGTKSDAEAHQLVREMQKLKNDRSVFDAQFEEAGIYVLPNRRGFNGPLTKGSKLNLEIFDSTAERANHKLAAAVHGALTTTAMTWFGFQFRTDRMNKNVAARQWLDECSRRIHQALSESNFDGEAVEKYEDLFGFGTGALLHEERDERDAQRVGFQGFQFRSLPLTDYWIREGKDGHVCEMFLELKMAALTAAEWFGEKNLGKKMRQLVKKEPYTDVTIALAIKRNYDARRIAPGQIAGPTQRRYLATYFDPAEKVVIKKDGFYEFPVYATRINKRSGEQYGRGIGLKILPDVKTLNKAKELGLKAWEKVLDPPMKRRHKGTMSAVKAFAGGITDVRRMEDLAPLYDSNAFRFDVSELKHRDLQMAIDQAYFIDQLQLPPVQESKTMSATEIEVRFEQMQRLLGPGLGAIVHEFMNPLLERCFNMMLRAGALPPPPQVLLEAQESGIDIEYVGPFARAQKMANVVAIQRWIADLGMVAEIDPTVFDGVNFDAYRKELAVRYGVPASVENSEEDVNEIRQQRQQQQAQQQQLLEAGAQSEIAKNLQGA